MTNVAEDRCHKFRRTKVVESGGGLALAAIRDASFVARRGPLSALSALVPYHRDSWTSKKKEEKREISSPIRARACACKCNERPRSEHVYTTSFDCGYLYSLFGPLLAESLLAVIKAQHGRRAECSSPVVVYNVWRGRDSINAWLIGRRRRRRAVVVI